MSDDVVIRVENLWKRYGTTVGAELKRLLSFRRNSQGAPVEDHGPWALRDINFEVRRGETLGVIGRNGAGKSTLLKVLAGVTPPTYGDIEMRGRIFPMIELNAGMHMDLTGRQNVHLLGAVMGFSAREMQDRMPPIEEFCELGEWFDRPVWMYSSGMLARLGFSVAINVEADVLLIDEVLSVGDVGFQRKSFAAIQEASRGGKTVLFVTHNVRLVQYICDRVALFNQGRLQGVGDPRNIVSDYLQIIAQRQARNSEGFVARDYLGQAELDVVVREIRLLDAYGSPITEVHHGETIQVEIRIFARRPIEAPDYGITVWTEDGVRVATLATRYTDFNYEDIEGEATLRCVIGPVNLLPGSYFLRGGIYDHHSGLPYDMWGWEDRFTDFVVPSFETSNRELTLYEGLGITTMPYRWEYFPNSNDDDQDCHFSTSMGEE